MKLLKKTLALFLALMLMLSTVAFAVGTEPDKKAPSVVVAANTPGDSESGKKEGETGNEKSGTTHVSVEKCENGSITVTTTKDKTAITSAMTGGKDVPVGEKLILSVEPAGGFQLESVMINNEKKVYANGSTIKAEGETMTFSATFVEKTTAGDQAMVDTYQIDVICSGYSNWVNYTDKKAANSPAEILRKYVKYTSEWGGRSEIVSGDYVNLSLSVKDADFASIFSDVKVGDTVPNIAVSTPGSSSLQMSSGNKRAEVTLTKTAEGYDITLTGLSYNGQDGNLELLVSGKSYNAKISAAIKNLTPKPTPTEPEKPELPTDAAKPYVIIKSYSYGGGDLVAGETRNVTMTFYNTSKDITVENMMVTMNLPADTMVLTSSSNTFYVERLEPEKSITKTVNVTVKPTAPAQSESMTINFTYDYIDNDVRKNASTEESISMPILQVDRFTVTGVEIEPQIFVNQEGSLSVAYVNKGRSEVYNISAKLSCPALKNDGEEQYIGNLASGTTSSADFYITALAEGEVTGEVIITYEDTNMNEQAVKVPFSTTAINFEEPAFNPDMDPGMMEEPSGGFPWYWIVLGVAVVAAGVVIFLKKRSAKKEIVEEDEDY